VISLSPAWIAILMLGGLVLAIMTGFPIALPVGFVALVVGYLVFGAPVIDVIYAQVYGILYNYILLALPLFVLMGVALEYSGIADKMYDALFLFLGGLRGGLAIITIIIGTVIAACVGVMSASVTLVTTLGLPAMIKRGYDKKLAVGAVAGAGTLGILIPPSVMLVVYGPMARLSVGKLFMAAFGPGLLLAFLYCLYIIICCLLQPNLAPTVPVEERQAPFLYKMRLLIVSLIPPTLIILSVLGVIFLGIAPPTEASAVGAFAALLLTAAYRRLNWTTLRDIMLRSLNITCMAYFIAVMSVGYTGVFLRSGAGEVVQQAVLATPGGRWGVFAMVMFIYFILGFFIEWIGIFFIMVPLLAPLAPMLGFDPVWFGIMICVNLQTSFLTPPYAFTIFIIRAAAPPELGVETMDIIRGIVPYVIMIIVGMLLCIVFPEIITWLPAKMIK